MTRVFYMVRGKGLEPSWVAPLAPKASASTNFATRAYSSCYIVRQPIMGCHDHTCQQSCQICLDPASTLAFSAVSPALRRATSSSHPLAPKASASTNFATRAYLLRYILL